mmetsp:Transcript_36805/g.45007  ORF Transcript_36805/g.45007 Transcript_36805/m.45007 type:complete len:87 (-) Transcript_36805:129-389(-)
MYSSDIGDFGRTNSCRLIGLVNVVKHDVGRKTDNRSTINEKMDKPGFGKENIVVVCQFCESSFYVISWVIPQSQSCFGMMILSERR